MRGWVGGVGGVWGAVQRHEMQQHASQPPPRDVLAVAGARAPRPAPLCPAPPRSTPTPPPRSAHAPRGRGTPPAAWQSSCCAAPPWWLLGGSVCVWGGIRAWREWHALAQGVQWWVGGRMSHWVQQEPVCRQQSRPVAGSASHAPLGVAPSERSVGTHPHTLHYYYSHSHPAQSPPRTTPAARASP